MFEISSEWRSLTAFSGTTHERRKVRCLACYKCLACDVFDADRTAAFQYQKERLAGSSLKNLIELVERLLQCSLLTAARCSILHPVVRRRYAHLGSEVGCGIVAETDCPAEMPPSSVVSQEGTITELRPALSQVHIAHAVPTVFSKATFGWLFLALLHPVDQVDMALKWPIRRRPK